MSGRLAWSLFRVTHESARPQGCDPAAQESFLLTRWVPIRVSKVLLFCRSRQHGPKATPEYNGLQASSSLRAVRPR